MTLKELISHPIWLKVFSERHYIFVFYDKTGNFVFTKNEYTFVSNQYYSELLRKSTIFDCFDVPRVDDLNCFFSGEKIAQSNFVLESDGGNFDSLPLPEICIWPIKKRYDVVDRLVQFYTIIPTRIISLFRVDDNLFAGIISSPFGSDEVEKMLSNRLSVMVNDEQKIVGYNGLLNRILGKKDNTELLEQHVSNVLRFDDNPFLKKENIAPSMKKPITVLSWFGEKEQLASSVNLSPSAKISEDRGEVTFNNSSGVDYAVMSMNEQVNVDAADVDIEIVCTLMDGLVLPNIVMRAMLYRKNSYIDDYGYSLAYSKENVFVFKRAGQAKMKLMLDERTKQEEVQILWCKRGWSHLFFINGRFMGKWVETNPFTLSSDNFVSVFLRPGEKSVLRSLTVRTEQPVMKTNSLPDNRLHASISSPEGVYHYNVTFEQKMVSTFNTTTYFLEDITKISNEVEKLKIEKNRLKQMLSPQIEMIGNSESVENVKRQIALLAKTDITVVLEGETGTGKEVAARLIHESSKRKHSPFIKIDCSTIPANLIESELFGHEKGAFTGAFSSREGRFESA
ncbi:MAG: sigma 54-interacting transcriptional regulator, partial [Fibrobacteres bacterium]|nr:sigma 54-interacting transcriptional regulator [Fibrobacterota bacterium]